MDYIQNVIDQLTVFVRDFTGDLNRIPVQIILDEHLPLPQPISTRDYVASMPTSTMLDLASRTRNVVDYHFIMQRVWAVLLHEESHVQIMQKTLSALYHILLHGSSQCIVDCQEFKRVRFLQNLAEEYNREEMKQYKFGKHLDCGAKVRELAGHISCLLLNEDILTSKRLEAGKMRQQLASRGLGAKYTTRDDRVPLSSQSSSRDLTRPPTYSDHYAPGSPAAMNTAIVTHRDEELRFQGDN
uniref:Uncharacterized protein AlNc14C37G3245 n=1 Tax=Albugo laibachii Nc14 TaxID=890382 RepID=F0W8X0_9STRA|nr:conserved hypothetical protein [Albugo laibachii Nc14]|eukprot:CCA17581.1 conserved hypothetical protein [Albugo laibachii Nc14]